MHPNNVGFHEVGFMIGRIGDGEFFLFGPVLNGENEEKRTLEFCLALFFLMWAPAGVLHGKGRTFLTLKNTSAKSA